MSMQTKHFYAFGPFRLDSEKRVLVRDGAPVSLAPKLAETLLLLVQNAGRLVDKDDLMKQVWPDAFVEEGNLNKNIFVLRKLLGEWDGGREYIETVPKRGYRFVAPVNEVTHAEGDAQARAASGASLLGKKVSHYRVLEIVGGGGMGVVYKAEDLKLGRRVALKFLPEELAADSLTLQRFEREARTASSLNHPSICTIHEVEEHEGQPFLVMELLEGETLRDRLASSAAKAVPLDQLLNIATQICDGLQAAHERGIIHRDIKPANIFISDKGVCKILDFGLAKLVAAGEKEQAAAAAGDPGEGVPLQTHGAPDATLTRTGLAMGTAGYMSPEQVRCEKLDARTDIFSFGLVLYEMATGQRGFTGETAAVVRDAILNSSPVPPRELNSTLPAGLVPIIDKALEKDRERRYQSAAGMRADLQELKQAKPRRIVRSQWRWYAAAALICVIAVAGLLYRRSHPPIKLTDKDTLVLADVTNRTGDALLDDSLDDPLSQELREAPYINLLNSGKVRETLQSMKLSGDVKLTPELAREVCLRTSSRAYVTTSIANAGNDYQIRLQATDCHSGKTLAAAETEAGDRNHIIRMLGLAGHNLRAALGEPADSLARFATPLEEDWTSSLEASKALSLGVRAQQDKGDAAALPFFQRAVELDPRFVLAYLNLGNLGKNIAGDNLDLSKKYETLGFNLRDRVSVRTRFLSEGIYYTDVTGELEKAKQTYLRWLREYPGDIYPHLNLEVTLKTLGQSEEAIVEAQEAVHLVPSSRTYGSLMSLLAYSNRLQEAKVVYEEARARGIDDLSLRAQRYQVAWLENDTAAMRELLTHAPDTPEGRDWALAQQGDIAIYQGRFRAAHAFYSAIAGYWPPSNEADYAVWDIETGNAAQAKESAQKALAANPEGPMRRLLVLVLARAGDVHQAERLADNIGRESPASTLVQNYQLPTIRAAMELNAGRAKEAIEILQVSAPYELANPNTLGDPFGGLYPCYIRGLAYLKLGEGKQAAAEFQKLVDHPALGLGIPTGPLSHLQLGRAQVMMGDKVAARKSYQDFLTLWKDADPDIPIYQQAKAEYARLR